jgi:phosphoribosylanthranilate isomerase
MPVQVKICGVSSHDALGAAVKSGASHIGFVFFEKSPRNVSLDQAAALSETLPDHVKAVALIVDPEAIFVEKITSALPRLGALQFHGEETADQIAEWRGKGFELWKAIPVRTNSDLIQASQFAGCADRVLYDAKPPKGADMPGGTGQRFDWTLLQGHRPALPWILAGGLDPYNVAEARQITGASFFDVSSGVESAPGIKDVDKIAAFLKATHDL